MKQKLSKWLLPAILGGLLLLTLALKAYSVLSRHPGSDWNYHSLQKIDRSQTNFSFIVLGDNKNSISVFKHMIGKINKEKALFAIDVGDLVYDGEPEKYSFFLKQAKLFKIPLLTAIGNHEVKEEGRAPYYTIFGRYYYSFHAGNAYFIILDDANEKDIDPWQMQWLRQELKKSQAFKYRFVFMHVPLYDPRPDVSHCLSDTNNAAELNRLFDHYKITMIFSSHIHAYFTGKWGHTPYIITGGAGAELGGKDPKHYFFHYIRVTLKDSGPVFSVVKMDTPRNYLFKLLYDAWIYAYAFVVIHFLDLLIVLLVLLMAVLLFDRYFDIEKFNLFRRKH